MDKINKKGQALTVVLVIAVIAIVGVAGLFAYYLPKMVSTQQTAFVQQTALQPGAADSAGGQLVTPTACPDSGLTLTLNGVDKIRTSTATGERHTVWIKNGIDLSGNVIWKKHAVVTDGGTTTLGGGQIIRVLFGNQSEVNDGAAYNPTLLDNVQLGCVDTTLVGNQKDRNSSAVTSSFFNSDDGLLNAGTDFESVDANGVPTLTWKLKTSSEDYFGDDGVMWTFDANITAFDKVTVLDGNDRFLLQSAPTQHPGIANQRSWAYELPELAGSAFVLYSVELDASGTDPANNNNITVTGYDRCTYVNALTDTPAYGYNDENGNDVCAPNARSAIAIS